MLWKLFVLMAKFLSEWSRRRHQRNRLAFLGNIVLTAANDLECCNFNNLICLSMIWRSMILEVRYHKMLMDLDEGPSFQINSGCRRMVLYFCRVYVWLKELFYDYENLVFSNQFQSQTHDTIKLGLSWFFYFLICIHRDTNSQKCV